MPIVNVISSKLKSTGKKGTQSSNSNSHGGGGARRDGGLSVSNSTTKPKTIQFGIGVKTGSPRITPVTEQEKLNQNFLEHIRQNSGSGNANNTSSKNTSLSTGSISPSASTGGYTASASNGGTTSDLQAAYLAQQQSQADNLSALLREQNAQHEAQLRAQQQAQQQAAQNAYNNNLSALQEAYQKKLTGLGDSLSSTYGQLESAYGLSKDNLNQSAEKALQEAYISRMMNEKNLRQQLNAQGITGGASESAVAALLNQYMNSRNGINMNTANGLKELEQNYNANRASALQSYNDAVNSLEDKNMAYRMQLENDLANNTVSSYQDLYNGLANMEGNYTNAMNSFIQNNANNNAEIQNSVNQALLKNALASSGGSSSSSAARSGTATNGSRLVRAMISNGSNSEDIVSQLASENYSPQEIAQIFAELGISL